MKKKASKAELSESRLNQYKHLHADAAPDLVANSRAIGSAEPEKKQRINHLELRKAVAKFLGRDPSVGDPELVERLAEEEAPPADATAQQTNQIIIQWKCTTFPARPSSESAESHQNCQKNLLDCVCPGQSEEIHLEIQIQSLVPRPLHSLRKLGDSARP
jgi:hypothetical protein